MKKKYCIELYGKDELLIEEWFFDKKNEQLAKYYELLSNGYKKDDIVKLTRNFYY